MTSQSNPFGKLIAKNSPATLDPAEVTMEQVQKALPTNLRSSVTQSLVDSLNNIAADPLMAETIKENFISYTAILKDGKFKIEDYLNAVKFVSYKLMEYNNEESYSRTFPKRYADLVARALPKKDIAAHISGYAKNKLVNLIMEQSLVPTWVLNQHVYQKAINTQVELMSDPDVSAKVRTDAANSLLTHLKKPEKHEFQINMETKEHSGMKELREQMLNLAATQKQLIDNGTMKTIDIAASRITDASNDDDHK